MAKNGYTIRQRGTSWQLDFARRSAGGKRIQKSFKTKAKATAWAIAKQQELAALGKAAFDLGDNEKKLALDAFRKLKDNDFPFTSLLDAVRFHIQHHDPAEVAHGEAAGGGTPLDPAVNDAGGDADGDGVSNLGEFLCGTDPLDPSSVLQIVGLALASGDGVTLSWDAAKLKHYRIDRCADPRTGVWEVVSGNLQALDDGVMTWAHPAGAASPKGFYRVVLIPE